MFYCPVCGNKLKEYRKFCTFCGAKLETYKNEIQKITDDSHEGKNITKKAISPSSVSNTTDYHELFELYSDEQLKEVLISGKYNETAVLIADSILEERINAKKNAEIEERAYLKNLFKDYTDEQLRSIEMNSSDYTDTARTVASVILSERKQAYIVEFSRQHEQNANKQLVSSDDKIIESTNEQDSQQMIDKYEREIISTFAELKSTARNVGIETYQAALDAQTEAMSKASDEKLKMIIPPAIFVSLGVLSLPTEFGFVGVIFLICGGFMAYSLNKQGNRIIDEARSINSSIVNSIDSEQRILNSVLKNNSKI